MTSKVIEGHKRYFLCLKINFFLNIFFVEHLILTKFCLNDYIIKTLFFHYMMFDLKGHIRSNRALYVYIFSSNNSSIKQLLSLYASLSFSFFPSNPPTPSSALYPPYESLSFLSPLLFFSFYF